MSADIRSKHSLPICISRSAHQDYFYLQDFGWYHFSKWECASAAPVIHLGSFDNLLWNVCSLFLKGNLGAQEQMNISGRGRDQESNLWLKESSRTTYTNSLQSSQIHSFASQCNYWHNHITFHRLELRGSHSAGFIKAPSYKKFTLLRNIFSKGVHFH